MENNNKETTASSDESVEMETKNEEKEATADDVVTGQMQRQLGRMSSSGVKWCIFKVPECIRKQKEECYRPLVVSIGPIFYKDPQLETMQEVKWIILESFLQHSNNACPRLDDYIKTVRSLNKDIRNCYQEQMKLPHDDEFVELIVLDAVFLLSFITMTVHDMIDDHQLTSLSPFLMDSLPLPRKTTMLLAHIERDLIVEENQLPFFVLKKIFGIACPTEPSLLIDVALRYIYNFDIFKNQQADLRNSKYEIGTNFEHLLDLWWKSCCLPYESQDDNAPDIEAQTTFDILRKTAKQLFAAGVEFKVNHNSRSPFDIKFDSHTGELQIPNLGLHIFSETYFRNLLFFEECHPTDEFLTRIIDFIFFLDELISTEEDIKVLKQHGVLSHLTLSEQQAADFFNDMNKGVGYITESFIYWDVSRQLNAYAKQPWNRWKAILKRDYFNHPWKIVSFIFAVILFILTLLQTITSFTKN